MSLQRKTIMISGGHLTPALAVIDELRLQKPSPSIVFVGREYAQEREKQKSRERIEASKRSVVFYTIQAAKFHRTYLYRNLFEMTKLIPSFFQVLKIIKKEKPHLFLSFGGYLAFPLALTCKLLRIPVITHEQTKTVGLANQMIGMFADVVAVSYEESVKHFPKGKAVVTGNPIRSAILQYVRAKPRWLREITLNKPILYVTGGSQGSHIINKTVGDSLLKLLDTYIVIHQCGGSSSHRYKHELDLLRSQLSVEQQQRYIIREWIAEIDVAWLFQHANIAVSRSGANTVQEIVFCKVPAIFIPLPFAHNDEQTKNAQWLVDHGSAVMIAQKDFYSTTFLHAVSNMHRRLDIMKRKAQELKEQHSPDAAECVAKLCMEHAK